MVASAEVGQDYSGRRLPLRTKIFYGIGSVAYGVKDNGFNYFLLLFYNQILGLPGSLAGLALFVALAFDAVTDPIIGNVSDKWKSKWGRRHPFMYVAALPLAIAFYLLWHPPLGASNDILFAYLIVLAILVRLFVTMFEVPNTALVAEFTGDYDQRTSIMSVRYFFGWWGGLAMAVFAYTVLFRETAGNPEGFSVAAFGTYGFVASMLILGAILTSSIGTHHTIPMLQKNEDSGGERFDLIKIFRETVETLSNQSFLALFMSSLLYYTAAGFSQALYNYTQRFFWELSSTQIGYISMSHFGSAALALVLAPVLGRGRNKRDLGIILTLIAVINLPVPIVLRLMGVLPPNGHELILPLLIVHSFIEVTVLVMMGIMISSMIADLVEDSQRTTERRSEGLFFAARTFAKKVVSGAGIFVAGIALDLISFPKDAVPGEVPQDVLFDYGIMFPLIYTTFGIASALSLLLYRIDRSSHADNLEVVSKRTSTAQAALASTPASSAPEPAAGAKAPATGPAE